MNTVDRDSDEQVDTETLIAEVIAQPGDWMDRPNDQLGGQKPRELLGTDSEERIRELARAIKLGMPT